MGGSAAVDPMVTKTKIMKFGGTSVGDASSIRRVHEIVAADGASPAVRVVVVSAPRGMTGLLLALRDDPKVWDAVSERAAALAAELSLPPSTVEPLAADLRRDVRADLAAPEKSDLLASYGERISAAVVAAYFVRRGLPAVAVDARDFVVTDDNFNNARYLEHPTVERSRAALGPLLARGELPVVTGFIGRDARGRTTTLGRGGSDLTATLLGAALGADVVEIWTDADGIMTADPRVIPEAEPLLRVSYEEAVELSNSGARVVFNKSLLPAMQAGLPVHVRNTFAPASPGTVIGERGAETNFALTSKSGVSVITVSNPEMIQAVGYLARLFHIFLEFNLSVDAVAVSEASVSMTVSDLSVETERRLRAELDLLGEAEVKRGRSIVTTISKYLDTEQAVFPHLFRVLTERGVDVEMISYGNREINLTIVVEEAREREALRLLHETFQERYKEVRSCRHPSDCSSTA
jgi:aspartate kinase